MQRRRRSRPAAPATSTCRAPMRRLRDAAKLWLIDHIDVYEDDRRLPAPRIAAARVSLPSDRSFVSYEEARAHVHGPRLADELDLYWSQQLLDVLLEYPIRSERSAFAIHPRVDRFGRAGADGPALPAAGRRRARLRVARRPRPRAPRSALASGGAGASSSRASGTSSRASTTSCSCSASSSRSGGSRPLDPARHLLHGGAFDLADRRRLRLRAGRALVPAADRDADRRHHRLHGAGEHRRQPPSSGAG